MKHSLPSLLAVGALALASLGVQAEPAPKIAVVDMAKLYETHWKTKDQMTKLKAEQQEASSEYDQMTKDLNSMVAQYKDLQEQSKDPMTTPEAKSKATSQAEALLQQIQSKANERNQFGETVQREFQQRIQNFHELIIDEVSKIATKIALDHGATLLLDKSAVGVLATKAVLYSDPSYDITDEVAAEIAKEQPPQAATPPPPAGTAPVTPPPASSSSSMPPPITVPGVTAPANTGN